MWSLALSSVVPFDGSFLYLYPRASRRFRIVVSQAFIGFDEDAFLLGQQDEAEEDNKH
jgi:hypothetical protein